MGASIVILLLLLLLCTLAIPVVGIYLALRQSCKARRYTEEDVRWFKNWAERAEGAKTNEEILALCREVLEKDKGERHQDTH